MKLFALARHPTRAIRIAFAALLLAFGLNAIAHVSHRHQSDIADDMATTGTSTLHTTACGYCATFGSLADTPHPPALDAIAQTVALFASVFFTAAIVRRTATSANPRAPPR